ncbi:UNKNOWN [Stylonychia lemnae]|uniref:Uncharacterized protein n=1 Tax=Stylonychia lemnae TaxID=5949 RepID=A0A078B6T0_STYLE|nr:UNKNOWN [Stylonychia lemnae]|eukprot:CDW90089.1 UNKNOWN [Stylonychia lemnae]
MPRLTEIKITQNLSGQNHKRQSSLLKNLKLNNIANKNDYFEKRATEYPFEGSRTNRSKEARPKLLIPLQNYQVNENSRFFLDNTTSQQSQDGKSDLIANLINKKNIRIINNTNNSVIQGFYTQRNPKLPTSVNNLHEISYLKDQPSIKILNQIKLKDKFSTINDETLNNLSGGGFNLPTNLDDIQRFVNYKKLSNNLMQTTEFQHTTLEDIIGQISKAISNPFSSNSKIKDHDETIQTQDEFNLLNFHFIKEVIPKNQSTTILNQFDQAFENKMSGEMFQELFKKHNLEHLLRKDNLIFQTLSQEKSLKDARIDHLDINKNSLGQPVSRKDAIILLKWLDSMMGKLKVFSQKIEEPLENQSKDEATIEEMRLEMIQVLMNVAFKEIIRQVSVQCIERGYALLKIFNAYLCIIEGMHIKFQQMKKDFKLKYRHKIQRVMSSYQNKREEANDEIHKFNREMARIRNHYEELKISEELLKKQLNETKDQLDHAKMQNEELKDFNKKLFKESKETRMELNLMKKNILAQENDDKSDIHSHLSSKQGHKNRQKNQRKKKRLLNLETEFLRTQTDDDYSLLSQLDKEFQRQELENDSYKVHKEKEIIYDLYETEEKGTQVDEKELKQRQEECNNEQDSDNNYINGSDNQSNYRNNMDTNNLAKTKYKINDKIKLFTNGLEYNTIQITDQSKDQNFYRFKSNQAGRNNLRQNNGQDNLNYFLNKNESNEMSGINKTEMNSVFNKIENTTFDVNLIPIDSTHINHNLNFESVQSGKVQFISNQSLQLSASKIIASKEIHIKNVDSKKQKNLEDFQSKIKDLSLLSEQELLELLAMIEKDPDLAKLYGAQKLLEIKQLINMQIKQNLIQINQNKSRNIGKNASLDNNSDDEIYQQNEIKTTMYQDLMRVTMNSQNKVFQSFHEDMENITIEQFSTPGGQNNKIPVDKHQENLVVKKDVKKGQHNNTRHHSINISSHQSGIDLQKNRSSNLGYDQPHGLQNDSRFHENQDLQASFNSGIGKRHNIDKHKFTKFTIPGTTEFNEFQLGQRRRQQTLKAHPAQYIFQKIIRKKPKKIKKIIPRKMVNKTITLMYQTRLECLLSQSEEHSNDKLYEFVYDMFIKRYGLKHIAEVKYTQFLNSVKKYHDQTFKIKMFARHIGLDQESEDKINFNKLNEDLTFYLGIYNYLNNLNVGNKIDNQDFNDYHYFAFVKVTECLRYIFESHKLQNEALNLIKKDLDQFKQIDPKFGNRLGVFDFDQITLYLIPKWRSLTTDYIEFTARCLFEVVQKEDQCIEDGLEFEQFHLLIRNFDQTKKSRTESIFSEYCSDLQKLTFEQFKVLINSKSILSVSSYIKFTHQKVKFNLFLISFSLRIILQLKTLRQSKKDSKEQVCYLIMKI